LNPVAFAFAGAEVLSNAASIPPGRFDDGDPRISFDGSWFIQHREGPWKATVHSSADPDAVASFRFDGTGIVVGAVLFDDRDNVQLCIDGTCHERRVFSPGLRWQEPIFVTNLHPGSHFAELRKKSGKLMDLDYVEVINERPLPIGDHSDTDPGVNHIGDWSQDNPERLRSMSANAAIYVPFNGHGVRWTVYCDQFGGRVKACLNSECRELDTLSAEPTTQTIDFPAKDSDSTFLLIHKLTGRSLTSAGFSIY
jgi:hypothetical protein